MGSSFTGLICNLLYKGIEYRFTTYNASEVLREELEPRRALYLLKKGKYKLHVEAVQEVQIDLPSPVNGAMDHSIKEGRSGEVTIKLYHADCLLYEDTGSNAGVEIMK